jgi:hypothetical protein
MRGDGICHLAFRWESELECWKNDHVTSKKKTFNRQMAGLTNQPYIVYWACDTPLALASSSVAHQEKPPAVISRILDKLVK